MSRQPQEFARYPDSLARLLATGQCAYGPYRAVSRFDARYDDGDTALFMIDAGWSLYPVQAVRFFGINAPEVSTPEGKRLRDQLALSDLTPGRPALLVTASPVASFGRDKYGRLLSLVFVANNAGTAICLNTELVSMGLAKPYTGWLRAEESVQRMFDAAS